ncbi:hypothetical protein [Mycolicibacterium sediminis]|uniref:PASTA domain-containing protein n=1 Tax=Mycolicibacterium sediminis TaxID=1286180 RepID=A0A7I7QYM0_9MYCO|nr:hypothetical protein [Mycolicibacterium sediminis]BBY31479.1 hypothetical protein MSEDJ_55750 [Mycolicibacterium sediminis]
MNTITRATLASAAALAALVVTTSPASATSSAELTIAQLEAQGFDVKVSRLGSAPLDECGVTDVRNAREQKRLQRIGDDVVEVVVRRTIAVTLDCSR